MGPIRLWNYFSKPVPTLILGTAVAVEPPRCGGAHHIGDVSAALDVILVDYTTKQGLHIDC